MITIEQLQRINGLYPRLLALRENIRRDTDYLNSIYSIETELLKLGFDPGSTETPPVPPMDPIHQVARAT